MLPYEKCKRILNSGSNNFNDEQIKQIIELLEGFAETSVELYLKLKENEKCNHNVKSKQ